MIIFSDVCNGCVDLSNSLCSMLKVFSQFINFLAICVILPTFILEFDSDLFIVDLEMSI